MNECRSWGHESARDASQSAWARRGRVTRGQEHTHHSSSASSAASAAACAGVCAGACPVAAAAAAPSAVPAAATGSTPAAPTAAAAAAAAAGSALAASVAAAAGTAPAAAAASPGMGGGASAAASIARTTAASASTAAVTAVCCARTSRRRLSSCAWYRLGGCTGAGWWNQSGHSVPPAARRKVTPIQDRSGPKLQAPGLPPLCSGSGWSPVSLRARRRRGEGSGEREGERSGREGGGGRGRAARARGRVPAPCARSPLVASSFARGRAPPLPCRSATHPLSSTRPPTCGCSTTRSRRPHWAPRSKARRCRSPRCCAPGSAGQAAGAGAGCRGCVGRGRLRQRGAAPRGQAGAAGRPWRSRGRALHSRCSVHPAAGADRRTCVPSPGLCTAPAPPARGASQYCRRPSSPPQTPKTVGRVGGKEGTGARGGGSERAVPAVQQPANTDSRGGQAAWASCDGRRRGGGGQGRSRAHSRPPARSPHHTLSARRCRHQRRPPAHLPHAVGAHAVHHGWVDRKVAHQHVCGGACGAGRQGRSAIERRRAA